MHVYGFGTPPYIHTYIIAKHTGKSEKEIEGDADRDHWLDAEAAAEYGLVDKVLENRKDLGDNDSDKEDKKKDD